MIRRLTLVAVGLSLAGCSSSGASKPGTPSGSTSRAPTVNSPPAVSASPTQPPLPTLTAPAGAVGQPLLSTGGHGSKNTAKFTVAKAWSIAYAYDCSGVAEHANFQICPSDVTGKQILNTVNQLNGRGSGVARYSAVGTFYLVVNTPCAWSLKVAG